MNETIYDPEGLYFKGMVDGATAERNRILEEVEKIKPTDDVYEFEDAITAVKQVIQKFIP